MKPQYQHKVMTSFFLWFDNYLLSEGAACSIKTGKFFIDQTDERLSNSYSIYASPYKQWVTDSGIALKSADVPNEVSLTPFIQSLNLSPAVPSVVST